MGETFSEAVIHGGSDGAADEFAELGVFPGIG